MIVNKENMSEKERENMIKENKEEVSFTEGSIFNSLIRFALPVLGALVLQAAYGAVDLLVVGRFGDATSISAVGTGSAFTQMITYIITSLAMGATITIGHHVGEQQPKKTGDAVGTTIILFIILGIVLTVVLEIFAGNIAAILQVPDEAFNKAVLYIRICSGGIIVIIAYNVISSILRGFGNAHLPFIFVSIACVVNIAGDLLLVGVFNLDVVGAAIATVGAQLVSVIASILVLVRQDLPISFSMKQCRIYKKELKLILRVGIPMAVQDTMIQISFLVINSVINHMGLMPSAGYSIAQKIVMFMVLIPTALMHTVSAFVAQNIGAGQMERARKGFYTAILTGCAVGAVIFCIGFFGGAQVSTLFTRDTEVISQSANYLKGYSFECILACVLFCCCGYFNGCTKSLPVMIQGITAALLVRIPIALLMSRLPDTSLTLVGLASPFATAYGILFFLISFAVLKRINKNK